MSDIQAEKELVEQHLDLILINPGAFKEAKERCTKFLAIWGLLGERRHTQEVKKSKLEVIEGAAFARALQNADGKTITEKKHFAVLDPGYQEAKERLGEVEANIKWLRTYCQIFENAHLTYRQLSRNGE